MQIDNIFLLASFSGLYLVGWGLGGVGLFVCLFYRSNSKKFNESFASENTMGPSSCFALKCGGEEMHVFFCLSL